MEVSSTNKDEEILNDKLPIDESINSIKELEAECFETENEKVNIDNNFLSNHDIDYDDDDSGEEFNIITKTSNANDLSPAKAMFSIKTISNSQLQNNYKLSKTAVDLDHPGNINGVPTIDYDLSKLVDEYKPWKKPGADVSDYFNYGFTEETWLLYCEKQKTLRLSQENSALKTLSGLQNFGYPLSGSHIHLGFNRANHKNSKGGLIDVIGGQQGEFKNKHGDINMNMVNKISTIPVQTGNVNVGPNQASNYISGLTNQAINNNLLNPIMSAAMAMGILPNAGNVQVLTSQSNAPIDSKMSQFNSVDGGMRNNHNYNGGQGNPGNWNNQNFDRANSVDSMHSHEDYDRKPYMKSERGSRRSEQDESRRYKSRERRERSSERRRRSRTRSRERAHDSKHVRKRNRTPEESRRHRKHSRDRHSSAESDRKHRQHRSNKRHRQSRSRSYDNRKDRHQRRHKSPGAESSKYKNYKDDVEIRSSDKNDTNNDNNNVKREMDYPNAD